MQRRFGIKRSFNCEDLPSIVGLDLHAPVEEEAAAAPSSRKRVKRVRALSTDSSCSAVCYCCDEEDTAPAKFMPSAPSSDALTPKPPSSSSSSAARLISPATSHAAVTPASPELAPLPCNLSSLPCLPSIRPRGGSSEFPATAALERFMLKQRRSPLPAFDDSDGDFSPSFENSTEDEATESSWPKFDIGDSPSPRRIDNFPWSRRVSEASSRKSSSVSVREASSAGLFRTSSQAKKMTPCNTAHFSFPSMASTCKLSKAMSEQQTPTVNQITDALARM